MAQGLRRVQELFQNNVGDRPIVLNLLMVVTYSTPDNVPAAIAAAQQLKAASASMYLANKRIFDSTNTNRHQATARPDQIVLRG